MRSSLCILPTILLAACGGGGSTVAGVLVDGAEATHVWVLGEPARAAVPADSFELDDVSGPVLDLRFADADEEVARMEIRGLTDGARLRLLGVWFEDGIAHPSAVESSAGVITINGIRMASAEAESTRLESHGTVLAVSDDGDALVVRPADGASPDLRVVVTPGTMISTADDDPASAEGLEFGDSVAVVGEREAGYLVASELVVPRKRARDASVVRDAFGRSVRLLGTPVVRDSDDADGRKGRGRDAKERGKGKGGG